MTREILPSVLKCIVNPQPVKDKKGNHKTDRYGRRIFRGSNHIDSRGQVHPHPQAFDFVVVL